MRRYFLCCVAACMLVAAVSAPAGAVPAVYTLRPLGHLLPDHDYSLAYDINETGAVAGLSQNMSAGYNMNAVLWTPQTGMESLGFAYGESTSWACGINDSDQVVGWSGSTAFLWQQGAGMTTLPLPYPSKAWGINDSGDVVGKYVSNMGYDYAFRWNFDSGVVSQLGRGVANAINNAGKAVGWYPDSTPNQNQRAYMWSTAGGVDIGVLPGGVWSEAEDINDSGQVVGLSGLSSGYHAFLWEFGGVMIDLGDLPGGADASRAYSINNVGQVVGGSECASGFHATVWTINDGMRDLNDLLDTSGRGWTLATAYAINDHGQIVGRAINPSGQSEAFLLTPVPEPSGLLALVCGLVGMVAMALRRREVGT